MKASEARKLSNTVFNSDRIINKYNEIMDKIKSECEQGQFSITVFYPGDQVVKLLERDGYTLTVGSHYYETYLSIKW